MRVAIYRRGHFNAAHRLYIKEWSDSKNQELFGKCANPNYHGHNYEIEVKVTGEVDPQTGMLINLKDLKQIIEDEIEEKFDHKNLDLDVPEFSETTSTVENICVLCWKILRAHLDPKYDIKVRLYETARNYAEYPAD